jgi:uncharacterized membrane protein
MKDRDLLMDWLPYGLGVCVVAGITHLAAIFIMPHVAPGDAFARIAAATQPNRFVVLERTPEGGSLLPFEDPRVHVAVCQFDIGGGPVRIQADFASEGLVIMSFHDRRGASFYGLTDRGGLRGKLDAVILDQDQLEAIEAARSEDDEPVQELRLAAPTRQGFVIARSLILDVADVEAARQRLASLNCAVERTQP